MKLEQSLVLNRYFHNLLGARDFEDLKQALGRTEEGPEGDGQSRFFHVLMELRGLKIAKEKFREYDARLVSYEARLSKARGRFRFKYFQYLSLIYAEIFVDRLTDNPNQFVGDLNAFLNEIKGREASLSEFPLFAPDDLRRLAFFMATGSGKTLLLHVHFWQILHYLEHGRHPEALVQRSDQRRDFDSILLITPNDGLSRQHLEEFRRSGIDAVHLAEDRSGPGLFPRIRVIEIHKLADEPSKEGVSILIDELGDANLVFVDEGHKGTGSEAQTWKDRQRRLSRNGFLLEYSATFAQSIGAASKSLQKALLAEYGKSILFDYSYRHFYYDGYGKDFRVLNLRRARESRAHDLLLGGLLVYYMQVRLFLENRAAYHPYLLEKPLWVFLGSSVNAVFSKEGKSQSDVAMVVIFLKRFLEEPDWAVKGIERLLKGESGFKNEKTKEDLFASYVKRFDKMTPLALYRRIAAEVFHGQGGLEIWEIKGAEGEFGLRISAPAVKESPYFGLINIGDGSSFKKHLEEKLGIKIREDRFTSSLFSEINNIDSRINVLIGSKKFIEGWSSWRVSAMGLLNIGKGQGPQVIQLFGRGVRLKGKKWSLKRSEALPEEGPTPEGLSSLETLYIFGWNADYVQTFQEMLEREEIGREIEIPLKLQFDPWPELLIPQRRSGYKVESETWTLAPEPLQVSVDLTPQIAALVGGTAGAGLVGERTRVDFANQMNAALLDIDNLYVDLLDYKTARGYGNLYIPRDQLLSALAVSTLYMLKEEIGKPDLVQEGALKALKTYLDRFVAIKEREAEGKHLEPVFAGEGHESVIRYYKARISGDDALLKELAALLGNKETELYRTQKGRPLPRLHIDRHLYTPVLLHPEDYGLTGLSISPPGLGEQEAKFLEDVVKFWEKHSSDPAYKTQELHILRNLPRVGVGFFQRSGFYPDFIVWVKNTKTKATHVLFLEPHGMHHGGIAGNQQKIEAFKKLQELSTQPQFKKKKIAMSGFILTQTELKDIPDAQGKNWEDLERDFQILDQNSDYTGKILQPA